MHCSIIFLGDVSIIIIIMIVLLEHDSNIDLLCLVVSNNGHISHALCPPPYEYTGDGNPLSKHPNLIIWVGNRAIVCPLVLVVCTMLLLVVDFHVRPIRLTSFLLLNIVLIASFVYE